MTLQQMEYIVALDKYRHFVLAAESCGVTQPTLSAMVQKLEEELDVRIFERSNRTVSPTVVGVKIIRQARTALNEAKRIREVVADETGSMRGTLRIGIIPTVAPCIVPDFICRFRADYPEVQLYIEELENKTLLRELENGKLDVGLAASPVSSMNLMEIPLYREKFVAYLSARCHKIWEQTGEIGWSLEHMWILKEGHCVPGEALNFCKNRDVGNHIYEAGSIETLVRIVDRNGGYTVIPELYQAFLSDAQRANIRELSEFQDISRTISFWVKKDFIRERMLNAVGDILKQLIPVEMLVPRFREFPIRLR